jgi:glyoxylase-like metal-dependent hydrolase (beta-lactamase superfamily II)
VVVDPRRDIEDYLQDAQQLGLDIELVLETHLHADFLSGHLEFAADVVHQVFLASPRAFWAS